MSYLEGEAIYFDSTAPHCYRRIGAKRTTALVVITNVEKAIRPGSGANRNLNCPCGQFAEKRPKRVGDTNENREQLVAKLDTIDVDYVLSRWP